MAIFLKKMKIFGNFLKKYVKFLAIFYIQTAIFPEGQVLTPSLAVKDKKINYSLATIPS